MGDGWFPIDSNPRFPLTSQKEMGTAIEKLREQIVKSGRKPEDFRVGYLASNFELKDHGASENGKAFVGNPQKILSDIEAFERLGVSFLAFSFLQENLKKTKVLAEKFAKEVLGNV